MGCLFYCLQVLDLSSNKIDLMPPVIFIRNTKLRYLDLSNNHIRSLPRDSLVGSAVEILNLGSNHFVNLPVGALSQVSGYTSICLYVLRTVSPTTFSN